MSNSFPKNCAKRKSSRGKRGVALVFTLGILGLLTVLALGFASTALLNRKISENTSNTVYAQNLARSIALARVMYGVEHGLDLSKLYSYSTDANSNYKDWLYKLETYLNGTRIFKYEPASNVRWQYIKDSDNKIVGRFAYVVVQDKGRLDPSVNVNDITNTSIGITGFSEKEVGINKPTWSDNPGYLNKAVSGVFRWATFGEVFTQLGVNIDADQKKTFFPSGINVGQLKSPETYWVDTTTQTGVKDKNELFLRFNIYRTDWDAMTDPMTPEKLVGENPPGTEIQISGSSKKSIDFIPWLKNWNYQRDATYWKKDVMAKQIAANIIQYNRADISDTVSDSTNWTTAAPTYAGIGRHPMLNELGFKLNVGASLSPGQPYGAPDGYEYRLTYTFHVSFGTELIDMFGLSPKANSEVTVPNFLVNATYTWIDTSQGSGTPITYSSYGQFKVMDATFNSASEISDDKKNVIPGATGWNTSYTTTTNFWKNLTPVTKEIVFRIAENFDYTALIKNQLKIKNISITPGNAILKYDSKDRDYASFSSPNTDYTEYDATEERTFSYALETADARVNHYPTDWVGVPNTGSTPSNNLIMTTTDSTDPDYYGTPGSKNNFALSITPITGEALGVNDPAHTASSRLSTSYIRHGQMKSLWELGCISRAEAWKTLNLSRKDIPSPPGAPTPYSPDYSYTKGDATLFDQIKLNETDEQMRYGKVNLNTDVANVLQALLDSTKLIYKKDLHNGSGDILLDAGTPGSIQVTNIINSILACTSIYSFQNRADLLVNPTNVSYLPGYDATKHSELATKLTAMQDLLLPPSIPKIEREEVISKIMPLLKTEPLDMVYVIVLAQTIRDVGGTPAYIDFDGDGEFSASDITVTADKKYQKTGYVRKEDTTWILVESTSLKERIISTTPGTYDIGADKITSEAKLVAVLVQDPVTRKWRIARYQYVE